MHLTFNFLSGYLSGLGLGVAVAIYMVREVRRRYKRVTITQVGTLSRADDGSWNIQGWRYEVSPSGDVIPGYTALDLIAMATKVEMAEKAAEDSAPLYIRPDHMDPNTWAGLTPGMKRLLGTRPHVEESND